MEQINEVIKSLGNPAAYPQLIKEVKTIITAVSAVFLTGDYAYKFNKPLNLDFLDFSTLEKRKEQCEKEVKYNSLISPELYLGVVPITQEKNGQIVLDGKGTVVEYAVKMKQVDAEATMNNLLRKGKVSVDQIRELAKRICQFHAIAPSDDEVKAFGSFECVKKNWDEVLEKVEKYQDKIVSKDDFSFLQRKGAEFLQQNKNLISSRVQKDKIKHCHGDFHSENVFMFKDKVLIFDGIVFNMNFPCSDVISEIAFMKMDLDFYGQKQLAEEFVQTYTQLSQDGDIPKLLPFYLCYRAAIRGWVASFTADDVNLTSEKKAETLEKAKKYYALAKNYALSF